MKTILSIIPKIFDKKLKNKIDDFKRLNDAYLMISNKELGGVLARFPYIFEIPIDQIKENIRVLRRYSFDTSHILILVIF